MSSKHQLRAQRDRARAVVAGLVIERNAALHELDAVRSERDDARARVAELEPWVDPYRWDRSVVTPQQVTLILPDGTRVTFDAVVTK